jgi:hypothetical protein
MEEVDNGEQETSNETDPQNNKSLQFIQIN